MNPCEDAIRKIAQDLPELATVNDLIRVGVVRHRNTLDRYRAKGLAPAHFRISDRIYLYPKSGIIKWLKERSCACEETIEDCGEE